MVLSVLTLASVFFNCENGYCSSRIGTVIDDILVGILPSLLGSLSQSCYTFDSFSTFGDVIILLYDLDSSVLTI